MSGGVNIKKKHQVKELRGHACVVHIWKLGQTLWAQDETKRLLNSDVQPRSILVQYKIEQAQESDTQR